MVSKRTKVKPRATNRLLPGAPPVAGLATIREKVQAGLAGQNGLDWAIKQKVKVQTEHFPQAKVNLRDALGGKFGPKILWAATEMMFHYALGKPKETHEVTGKDGGPIRTATLKIVEVVIRDGDSVPQ